MNQKWKNYLDGTIVTGFDDYDKESFSVLKKLSKNNIVVIATGRPFRSSYFFYKKMKLNTPIINYNGALLHHPKDPHFPKQMIYINHQKLIDFIHENQDILVNVFCEIEDDIYLWKDTEEIRPYLHVDGGILHVGDLEKILPGDSNGAILFSKPGSEERLETYVKDVYQDEVKIRHWFTNDVLVSELYSPETSKANAIKTICDYYHISYENTIAIGDGHNDIEMLSFCHIGVAMKNSHPDLIKIATCVTDDVKHHGVAKFFKEYQEN